MSTHDVMHDVLGLILGGGQGTRLYPLTQKRSKPAVPLAGKYRLIDIPISNCIHAGIDKVAILTQFNSVSLHRHIQRTYQRDMFTQGWVEILAAQQTFQESRWYQGTADAVRQQEVYEINDFNRVGTLLMLKENRIDAFLDSRFRLNQTLSEFADELDKASFRLEEYRIENLIPVKLYLAFADTERGWRLADMFDNGFEKLLNSGKLKTLFNKWNYTPFPFE